MDILHDSQHGIMQIKSIHRHLIVTQQGLRLVFQFVIIADKAKIATEVLANHGDHPGQQITQVVSQLTVIG